MYYRRYEMNFDEKIVSKRVRSKNVKTIRKKCFFLSCYIDWLTDLK